MWILAVVITEGVYARQVLPASGAHADAVAQSRTIYLNHTGALLRPGDTDARTNTSSLVTQPTQLPAWDIDDGTWADTVACFRDLWSRFDVQVVDQDPGDIPHIEAVFGGTPQQIGLPPHVLGVSPFAVDCSIVESSIVFEFTGAVPSISSREACEVMAQEVAHSYGLDHELLASDPMTYLGYAGDRAFQDRAAPCGEYEARPCGFEDAPCRPSQNSVQLLYERVGRGSGQVEAPPSDDGGCSATGSSAGLIVAFGLVGLAGRGLRKLNGRLVRIGPV